LKEAYETITMCDRCAPYEEKIIRYRFMARWINDERAQRGLSELIEQNEAKKRELHPEPKD
jgi:hypothetical protein